MALSRRAGLASGARFVGLMLAGFRVQGFRVERTVEGLGLFPGDASFRNNVDKH